MRAPEAFAPLLRPAYLACAALFVVHQVAQAWLGQTAWLIDGYLDPVLSIPLLLTLGEVEQRWLLRTRDWRGYSAVEVAAMTTALALVFEYVFPRLDPARQTYDPWDFVAYALGGGIYYALCSARSASMRLSSSAASAVLASAAVRSVFDNA